MKISYIKYFLATLFLGLIPVGIFNALIDPLWYFRGNQLSGTNFSFDDRLAKTNLFLNTYQTEDYNCILLGSSRTIAMRADDLSQKSDRCFNYSLRGGRVREYVVIAKFIRSLGIQLQRVYVGIDKFNFRARNPSGKHPIREQILTSNAMVLPEPVYRSYLSWDILAFNYRAFFQNQPRSNHIYDQAFQGKIRENRPTYEAQFKEKPREKTCYRDQHRFYLALTDIFPEAQIIGYIPPISSWKEFSESYLENISRCTSENILKIAEGYDYVYDFSLPSPVTTDAKMTFDGSHFYDPTHATIAKILLAHPVKRTDPFGYRVTAESADEYQQTMRRLMQDFVLAQGREDLWQEYLRRSPHEKVIPSPYLDTLNSDDSDF